MAAFLHEAWGKLGVEPPQVTALLLTSCRPENITGLEELIHATRCGVVTSTAGRDVLGRICPEARVLTTDDLQTLGWPAINALATPGGDETAVAYHYRLVDDEVLVTGDLPFEMAEDALRELLRSGAVQTWDLAALEGSLEALGQLQPKLWLSAHPLHGRNANQYAGDIPGATFLEPPSLRPTEWRSVLTDNRDFIRQLKRTRLSPRPHVGTGAR